MNQKERDLEQNLEAQRERLLSAVRLTTRPRIVDAIAAVPREEFVPPDQRQLAYHDIVLPIPGYEGRATISQPTLVALMTDLLNPQPDEQVLEVGTASGYQAAILSKLARRVVTIEIFESLASQAQKTLKKLKIDNVEVVVADAGTEFVKPVSFEKVIATTSVFPSLNLPIFSFLKENGVLVAPIGGVGGDAGRGDLVSIRRRKDGYKLETRIPGVSFVPMEGVYGWKALIPVRRHDFFKELERGRQEDSQ